jgi:hypothetical protein
MNRFAQPAARLHGPFKVMALTTLSVFMAACADRPSPDATGVRSNEPPYPVLMTDSADRKEAALADWTKIAAEQGLPSSPAPDHPQGAGRNHSANAQAGFGSDVI